jgi:hypothetical protein
LARRWSNILLGRSYQHVPQPVGRHFETQRVGGYYNDLTRKVGWGGATDDAGVPVDVLRNGKRHYVPVTIAQMALGAYDLWLETKDDKHKETFLSLAGWFRVNQDASGGWETPWTYVGERGPSPYSGMAQGQAISVLVRAHHLDGDTAYLDGARGAYELLLRPVRDGGCCVDSGDALYFEEYPSEPKNTVLNGWIFAIFGVYDLALSTEDPDVRGVFDRVVATLDDSLPSYDTGYWSFYDRKGHIASPFYHTLHSALLDALFVLTGRTVFENVSTQWKTYEKSALNRSRALTVKVWQKLRHPTKERIGG